MNVGFIHNDDWPLNNCWSIQSWQIFSRLQKHHKIFTSNRCPFPGAIHAYSGKKDGYSFVQKIDALFIIIDGVFDFYSEKFTMLPLLKRKKIPVIWLINAPIKESTIIPSYDMKKYKSDCFYRKQLSRFVDVGICVSNEVEAFAKKELLLERTVVVPNGADTKLFDPQKTSDSALSAMRSKYKVVWAGGGKISWQGLDIIAKVAKKIKNIDPDILFIVIGGDNWIDAPILDNIMWLKTVPYSAIPSYLKSADLSLILYNPQFTSHFYNSPMKLFDSMSMGLPIIASDLGQISEIIKNNKNGLLTDNSVNDIIKKILFIKNNKKFGKKLGLEARKDTMRYYNWDRMVDSIENELSSNIKAF